MYVRISFTILGHFLILMQYLFQKNQPTRSYRIRVVYNCIFSWTITCRDRCHVNTYAHATREEPLELGRGRLFEGRLKTLLWVVSCKFPVKQHSQDQFFNLSWGLIRLDNSLISRLIRKGSIDSRSLDSHYTLLLTKSFTTMTKTQNV